MKTKQYLITQDSFRVRCQWAFHKALCDCRLHNSVATARYGANWGSRRDPPANRSERDPLRDPLRAGPQPGQRPCGPS